MPWSVFSVEDRRREFIEFANRENANVSALAQQFGISRKTAYKWLNRWEVGASAPTPAIEPFVANAPLRNRSRRPHNMPTRTDSAIETKVLAFRHAHPCWGGRKLATLMQREHGITLAPSTITAILHRHGCISAAASAAATPWQRFEHERPNALWQIDFKGHFALSSDTLRCHPLTVLDDHSRFNIVLQACSNERGLTVMAALTEAFRRYGLPERINADNGAPWGNQGHPSLTSVGVWLVQLGISVSHSRPLHPQTNGKDERFHRTLKAELLNGRSFATTTEIQSHFNQWRDIYNCVRPHEALNMQTPATRYSPSTRPFPETIPVFEYAPNDHLRKVQDGGVISYKNKLLHVGAALKGHSVALRQTPNPDTIDIYFRHHKIRTITRT